ncbi:MAG: DUF4494 domain-containing protein [Actinomycetaceae bacterium]|nr:DUF4494 domain-containing protein [Actinomycetaceae bacterium]
MEDGLQKKVTELYTIDALSHAEAEERIIEEMSHYISGEYEVTSVVPAPYKEVFFSDSMEADRYFKAKLAFITINEKTEKEKRTAVTYLIHAQTFDGAVKAIHEVMGGTMIDYIVLSVAETNIMDVFEYKKPEETEV